MVPEMIVSKNATRSIIRGGTGAHVLNAVQKRLPRAPRVLATPRAFASLDSTAARPRRL